MSGEGGPRQITHTPRETKLNVLLILPFFALLSVRMHIYFPFAYQLTYQKVQKGENQERNKAMPSTYEKLPKPLRLQQHISSEASKK